MWKEEVFVPLHATRFSSTPFILRLGKQLCVLCRRFGVFLDYELCESGKYISKHLVNSDLMAVCQKHAPLTACRALGFSVSVCGVGAFPLLSLRWCQVKSLTILGRPCHASPLNLCSCSPHQTAQVTTTQRTTCARRFRCRGSVVQPQL